MEILKTPLEKTRTKVSKLIDELRGSLGFQGRKFWGVVSQKILLWVDEERRLFLGGDSSTPPYIRDAEHVILF
ncbi:MAG: hypothetical protein PVI11_03765 [Candidatus Aminicenantes bacterium]